MQLMRNNFINTFIFYGNVLINILHWNIKLKINLVICNNKKTSIIVKNTIKKKKFCSVTI